MLNIILKKIKSKSTKFDNSVLAQLIKNEYDLAKILFSIDIIIIAFLCYDKNFNICLIVKDKFLNQYFMLSTTILILYKQYFELDTNDYTQIWKIRIINRNEKQKMNLINSFCFIVICIIYVCNTVSNNIVSNNIEIAFYVYGLWMNIYTIIINNEFSKNKLLSIIAILFLIVLEKDIINQLFAVITMARVLWKQHEEINKKCKNQRNKKEIKNLINSGVLIAILLLMLFLGEKSEEVTTSYGIYSLYTKIFKLKEMTKEKSGITKTLSGYILYNDKKKKKKKRKDKIINILPNIFIYDTINS